ncbi:MAG: ATP-binding protein, partial [Chitinophagaceae bacterium]
GFQCVVKDITQRKEMENVVKVYEEKLVENQARLQSILDNATTLIYIKDLDRKYILINKQFKSFLKVTDEEVIGKTDFDYVDHVQAQRFKDSDDEVIKTLKPVELEDVVEMEDGLHNILIIKFPLLDAQNKIYGISGIATDITERVKYQEQLIEAKKIAEQAQELQEQFLANMSHEIRTPMNGIKGMTDLLLETALNNEQKDFTKTIQRSSDNLLVIINDILDLSKIQAGKLTIEKIDFNLTEVLDNIKVLFKYLIAEKGLILQIGVDADVPKVLCGDPYRLNQILVNLIGNAIKFTLSGGVDVKISVQEKRDKEILVSFEITDTGIGIATDKIGKIFDSFTQGSMTTTRKYGGTGLGLSITKRLLELQEGEISVESKVNNGSTFQFTIPYKYSDATSSTVFIDKDSKEYRSLLMGKKFLVVEDNEINQKVVKHVLQQAGGTVEVANHGLEAVAMLQKNSGYDLIVMDLQMPEMDGYEATRYIRTEMKLTNPIIAMTANALKGEREKCLAAGMNDYISKPFDFGYFYKRLSLLVSEIATANPIVINDEACTDDGLYDLSLLEEMDDKEYISDILTIFLEETPVDLKALHKACVASDFHRGYQIAHKLKSLSWLIKANCLALPLVKIEEDTKAEKSETLVHLSELAGNEFEKINKPLRDYLKNIQ